MIRLKDLLLEQAAKPTVSMKKPTVLQGAERLQWDIPEGFWHVEYSPDIPMILRKNGASGDRTKLTNVGTLSDETGTVSFIVRKNVTADGGITNIQLNKISDRQYALKISVDSGNSRKPGKSDAKVELSGFVPGYSYVIYDADDNSHLIRFIVKAVLAPAGETGSTVTGDEEETVAGGEEETVTSGEDETAEVDPRIETTKIGIVTKSRAGNTDDDWEVGQKLFQKYGDESKTIPASSEKKKVFGGKYVLNYYDRIITRGSESTDIEKLGDYQDKVELDHITKIHDSMLKRVKKYIETNITNVDMNQSDYTFNELDNSFVNSDNLNQGLYDKNENLVYVLIKKSNYATYQYKQKNNGHWSDIVTIGHTVITITPYKPKKSETEN